MCIIYLFEIINIGYIYILKLKSVLKKFLLSNYEINKVNIKKSWFIIVVVCYSFFGFFYLMINLFILL